MICCEHGQPERHACLNCCKNELIKLIVSEDKKLEDDILKLYRSREAMSKSHKEIFERLDRLEKEIDEINNGLIKRVGILGEALQGMSDENARLKYKPHKCPVCDGKGNLLYKSSHDSGGICVPCKGHGILWG